MLPIRIILYPTDFSERAQAAFQVACALARDHGARLILLHVVSPPVIAYGETITDLVIVASNERTQELLNQLKPADPTVPCERQFKEGDPAAQILAVAKATQCDLIVMGTHGRTGLGRLLMGSVAEQVVRRAPCPVLTVKTPFPGAERIGESS
jgi:nucleotide-binding universal stress UspA family protein